MITPVQFGSLRLMREFTRLDPLIYPILVDLLETHWPDYDCPARITCIFRSPTEELFAGGKSGIHALPPPYRALDIGAKEFTQDEIRIAADGVNSIWAYDPTRPAKLVCFVEPHGTGPHFHIQVHPNTCLVRPR